MRAPLGGQHRQDGVEILAEAEVEHRVGLVEDDGGERRGVDPPALERVAQAPRRGDDDRGVRRQRALLVHVARATRDRRDAHAERRVQPGQLVGHLLRELARRREDEDAGPRRPAELGREVVEQVAHGEADRDRLARPGLRRDAEVAPLERLVEHGLLHRA